LGKNNATNYKKTCGIDNLFSALSAKWTIKPHLEFTKSYFLAVRDIWSAIKIAL
jgi:hypothetical protein